MNDTKRSIQHFYRAIILSVLNKTNHANHTLTACPNASSSETLTTTTVVPTTVAALSGTSTQQYLPPGQTLCAPAPSSCSHVSTSTQSTHHCQVPCSQHHHPLTTTHQSQQPTSHQVQAATQTPQTTSVSNENKKQQKAGAQENGKKKGRLLFRHQNQQSQGTTFQQNQIYQIEPNTSECFGFLGSINVANMLY